MKKPMVIMIAALVLVFGTLFGFIEGKKRLIERYREFRTPAGGGFGTPGKAGTLGRGDRCCRHAESRARCRPGHRSGRRRDANAFSCRRRCCRR